MEMIPRKYTCDGENINPPLIFEDVPSEAKSLVLLMDDPDIPDFVKDRLKAEKYDHWVVYNIPPETREIYEGVAPRGLQGVNSSGKVGYTGPCPPDREHRYFFRLFALDTELALESGASGDQVFNVMRGRVLDSAELIGLYKRE